MAGWLASLDVKHIVTLYLLFGDGVNFDAIILTSICYSTRYRLRPATVAKTMKI